MRGKKCDKVRVLQLVLPSLAYMEAIKEATLAKNKLQGFQMFQSKPRPSSVKTDTYKTEIADFIYTNSGNIGGKKCS